MNVSPTTSPSSGLAGLFNLGLGYGYRRSRRPKDSQQRACYTWEDRLCLRYPALKRTVTQAEAKALVERIWADWVPAGKTAPRLTFRGKSGRAFCSWNADRLNFTKAYLYVEIVIHEVAHAVQIRRWGIAQAAAGRDVMSTRRDYESHGPEFCALLLRLLMDYSGAAIDEQEAKRLTRPGSLPGCYERVRRACYLALRLPFEPAREYRRLPVRVGTQAEAVAAAEATLAPPPATVLPVPPVAPPKPAKGPKDRAAWNAATKARTQAREACRAAAARLGVQVEGRKVPGGFEVLIRAPEGRLVWDSRLQPVAVASINATTCVPAWEAATALIGRGWAQ